MTNDVATLTYGDYRDKRTEAVVKMLQWLGSLDHMRAAHDLFRVPFGTTSPRGDAYFRMSAIRDRYQRPTYDLYIYEQLVPTGSWVTGDQFLGYMVVTHEDMQLYFEEMPRVVPDRRPTDLRARRRNQST